MSYNVIQHHYVNRQHFALYTAVRELHALSPPSAGRYALGYTHA